MIIKEKQGKKSRRTTFILQQQETEKFRFKALFFGLDLMFNQQDQNSLIPSQIGRIQGQGREIFR